MSAPLSAELRNKYGVSMHADPRTALHLGLDAPALQVRSVPIRKDDEVQVVRGTLKVSFAQTPAWPGLATDPE
jgi:hypothetical protein